MRRGKLVEIPPKWVGKTVGHQTKNKRQSKMTDKLRRNLKTIDRSGKKIKPPPTVEEYKDLLDPNLFEDLSLISDDDPSDIICTCDYGMCFTCTIKLSQKDK